MRKVSLFAQAWISDRRLLETARWLCVVFAKLKEPCTVWELGVGGAHANQFK